MQHFATHLRPGQQTTHSLRAGQYKNITKRKHDDESEGPLDGPGDDAKGLSPASNAQLTPSDIPQTELPPPPFPHSAARSSKDQLNYAKVQQQLSSLNPAVYAADATSKSHAIGGTGEKPALRQTHLDVLSAVMHRCLLEGDYDRAARAWGMILRTQVAGRPIDPRNHARWGIGAETLLRRKHPSHFNSSQNEHDQERGADDEQSRAEGDDITDAGFELARDYYERFIVQYPHHKTSHPQAVDNRIFYPPMFSIWIRSVLEKSKDARRKLIERQRARSASVASEGDTTVTAADVCAREEAIHDEEIARAREICERLDQLVVSPPFDKHAQLLLLRANVGLWISDLIVGARKPQQQDDDEDWNMDASEDDIRSAAESTTEKMRKHTDSLAELRRAQEYFIRAEKNTSGSAGAAVSRVEMKIKDLIRQIAKLGG